MTPKDIIEFSNKNFLVVSFLVISFTTFLTYLFMFGYYFIFDLQILSLIEYGDVVRSLFKSLSLMMATLVFFWFMIARSTGLRYEINKSFDSNGKFSDYWSKYISSLDTKPTTNKFEFIKRWIAIFIVIGVLIYNVFIGRYDNMIIMIAFMLYAPMIISLMFICTQIANGALGISFPFIFVICLSVSQVLSGLYFGVMVFAFGSGYTIIQKTVKDQIMPYNDCIIVSILQNKTVIKCKGGNVIILNNSDILTITKR